MKRLQKVVRMCGVAICMVAVYALVAGCECPMGKAPAKEKAAVEKAPEAKKTEAPAPAAKPGFSPLPHAGR